MVFFQEICETGIELIPNTPHSSQQAGKSVLKDTRRTADIY